MSKLFHGIRNGLSQMAVMLKPPHLKNACIAYTIQFCILFGWVNYCCTISNWISVYHFLASIVKHIKRILVLMFILTCLICIVYFIKYFHALHFDTLTKYEWLKGKFIDKPRKGFNLCSIRCLWCIFPFLLYFYFYSQIVKQENIRSGICFFYLVLSKLCAAVHWCIMTRALVWNEKISESTKKSNFK